MTPGHRDTRPAPWFPLSSRERRVQGEIAAAQRQAMPSRLLTRPAQVDVHERQDATVAALQEAVRHVDGS